MGLRFAGLVRNLQSSCAALIPSPRLDVASHSTLLVVIVAAFMCIPLLTAKDVAGAGPTKRTERRRRDGLACHGVGCARAQRLRVCGVQRAGAADGHRRRAVVCSRRLLEVAQRLQAELHGHQLAAQHRLRGACPGSARLRCHHVHIGLVCEGRLPRRAELERIWLGNAAQFDVAVDGPRRLGWCQVPDRRRPDWFFVRAAKSGGARSPRASVPSLHSGCAPRFHSLHLERRPSWFASITLRFASALLSSCCMAGRPPFPHVMRRPRLGRRVALERLVDRRGME